MQKPHTPSKFDGVYDVEGILVKHAMLLRNPVAAIRSSQDIAKQQHQSLQEARLSNADGEGQDNLRFQWI